MIPSTKFWDKIAEKYSQQPIADEAAYQKKLAVTRDYLRPDMEVLEMGCGTGSTAILHAPFVKHIRAIDFSANMIAIAQGKAEAEPIENVTFEQATLEDLDIPDQSLDAPPLELDHVFILVEPEAQVADRLLELGFQEGPSNTHPGQGTANRRFYFTNGMVEFLWVRDANEANMGPGKDLRFPERTEDLNASPFGMIFVPGEEHISLDMPFPGWHYQPDYFPPPKGFHVGANAKNLMEPLCFYFPFHDPGVPRLQPTRNAQTISEIVISTPSTDTAGVLARVSQTDRFSVRSGKEHFMEITLDHHDSGCTKDFRPAMPLILRW